MRKHLIFTVHGVGQQIPGETVDEVVAGALASQKVSGGEVINVSDQNFTLPSHDFPDPDAEDGPSAVRKNPVFPVHTRRLTRADEPDRDKNETVFAEVYWADLSPAPGGTIQVLLSLVQVILGIGYLALDNAENTRERFVFLLVHGFTWLFYGGIAALNALMIIGSTILFLDGSIYRTGDQFAWPNADDPATHLSGSYFVLPPEVVLIIVALLTAGLGLLVRFLGSGTYLVRIFSRSLIFWSVVSVLLVLLTAPSLPFPKDIGGEQVNTIACVLTDGIAPSFATLGLAIETHTSPVHCFVEHIINVSNVIWLCTLVLAALMFAAWLLPHRTSFDDDENGQREIFASICSGMILFWLVAVEAIWLTFDRLTTLLSTPLETTNVANAYTHEPDGLMYRVFRTHLEEGLDTMPITASFLVLFAFVLFGLILFRLINRKELDEKRDIFSRLLLNPMLQIIFAASTATIFAFAMNKWVQLTALHEFEAWLTNYWDVTRTLLIFLIVLVYFFSGAISSMVGVLSDIVLYAVRTKSVWKFHVDETNYPRRIGIENRFERVVRHMIAVENPDQVTFVTHSLGTVVATRCLKRMQKEEGLWPEGSTLVTMGSPVTHIHRKYFPKAFWLPREGFRNLKWINIYRRDDFVGTRVDLPPDAVQNVAVEAAGHPDYFTDSQVWKVFRDKIQFSAVPKGR